MKVALAVCTGVSYQVETKYGTALFLTFKHVFSIFLAVSVRIIFDWDFPIKPHVQCHQLPLVDGLGFGAKRPPRLLSYWDDGDIVSACCCPQSCCISLAVQEGNCSLAYMCAFWFVCILQGINLLLWSWMRDPGWWGSRLQWKGWKSGAPRQRWSLQ